MQLNANPSIISNVVYSLANAKLYDILDLLLRKDGIQNPILPLGMTVWVLFAICKILKKEPPVPIQIANPCLSLSFPEKQVGCTDAWLLKITKMVIRLLGRMLKSSS